MLDRIINWVKALFHEETPEEQDKRIHETIKSWKDNIDKMELARIDAYCEICEDEFYITANAKEWTVRSEDIKECEDEYKKSLNMH